MRILFFERCIKIYRMENVIDIIPIATNKGKKKKNFNEKYFIESSIVSS